MNLRNIDFKSIDLSPQESLNRILALPYPPAIIHATGGGYHCYAPVTGDEFERAETLLKRLAFLIGGDVRVLIVSPCCGCPTRQQQARGAQQVKVIARRTRFTASKN